ncbi:helix-turn-helix domain-containing protein [Methanobacterium sp. SMA-27]|uniref:helix-turn-helix domain-containing protein n=1 Tax=Methanobacterium sp. SMA-27 TaxID=1495336 RepID=UPI00064FCF1A|nr:helix-turn-helix domain-containing protein [Methanobacterium sp. SMA-27]
MPSKKISKQNVDDICKKYQEGTPTGELASKYKVSTSTIRYHLNKKGIVTPQKYKFSLEEEKQICNEYIYGKGSPYIAKRYKTNDITILKILKRNNINLRDGMRKISLSDERIICNDHIKGKKINDLAGNFNVTQQTIRRILKKNNVKLNPQTKFNRKEEDQICKEYEEGISAKFLGKKYNVHQQTIGKILNRNGIILTKRIITPEIERHICKEYQKGTPTGELASNCEVSRKTILKYLKKNNIKLNPKSKKVYPHLSVEEEENICNDYLDGLSSVKIANMYRRNPNTIIKVLRRNNIEIKSSGRVQKVNTDNQTTICKKYKLGATTYDLADEFDVSPVTIHTILKIHKIEIRKRGEHSIIFSKLDIKQICNAYDEGSTSLELGEKYNCSPSSIINVLQENSIKIRDSTIFNVKEEKSICTEYKRGLNIKEVAKKYNCHVLTIYGILNKYEVERRANKGENHSNWKGGISFAPYCPKFNEEFRERVRNFWNRQCGICEFPEKDGLRRLSVHHVNYEKMVCCDNTPPLFIPLCPSCHSKTNNHRITWENYLTSYIMTWFDGNSYLPSQDD